MNFFKGWFGGKKSEGKPSQSESGFRATEASKSKQQMLEELQEMFNDQAGSIFPFASRFREPYGKLAVHFVGLARDLGSKAPIGVFRKAVDDYPTSGLAWFALHFAITMCETGTTSDASRALAQAANLGCDYARVENGKITITQIE